MIVDYADLKTKMRGASIPKPLSATLSGHAAGEPFDKHVYERIKRLFPTETFRQHEYLNDLYSKNPTTIGDNARRKLFNSPTILFLLSRGQNATDKWNLNNPFEEKQNDTADILVVQNDFYEIIDIKTRNVSKSAQPPNIISAYKLAHLCAKMLDNKEFDNFTINYFEIDWELEKERLVCRDAHFGCLFHADPVGLYINWAAAMQIQFHVCDLDQTFQGDREKWAKEYLKHFVNQAKRRAEDMIKRFVEPFEKYIA
ncbi:MAG: HincII family type II restriction endonuclease [Tannerellaceae bacterium]|jgi:type II restriction enzyme|nr:HincII family type II restriction endonuclease [Tannerellaceae bacterium]